MPRNLQYGIVNVEACGWRRVSQLDGGTISWVCMAASTYSNSTTLQNEKKKRTYVRTTRAVLPPKIPALWSERTRSNMSRVFSRNYRCISVRQLLCGNYFIYTLSYISNRPWCCAIHIDFETDYSYIAVCPPNLYRSKPVLNSYAYNTHY